LPKVPNAKWFHFVNRRDKYFYPPRKMAESIDEYCSWQTEEIPKSNDTFAWQDYLILGCTLGISTVIGVYFAWKDRNKNADEYMMGGGNVSPYPIAMSLATTFFSGHGFLFMLN
jgi:hypothetical protein